MVEGSLARNSRRLSYFNFLVEVPYPQLVIYPNFMGFILYHGFHLRGRCVNGSKGDYQTESPLQAPH